MNPYLTKQAYEKEIEVKSASPDPVLQPADQEQHSDYEPKFGDYMLYVGLPDVRPYYIVKVISYDPDTGLLTFHYLNNTHAKTKHSLVWIRRRPNKKLKNEWHTNDQPSQKVWKPNTAEDDRSQFCWTAARLQNNTDGTFRITNSEVQRCMRYRHQLEFGPYVHL